jgi:16S rRNA (guanine527-N7)-methyltransferase
MSGGPEALPPEEFRDLLRLQLPRWNLTAPGATLDRLSSFLAELDRWRRRINLTGRLSPGALVAHALESILGERFLPQGARVVDIGTGGGFPGVPIAVWRPDLEMNWLEPREKRAAFLRHVARTIPVGNARILQARLGDLPGGPFEYATSRALKVGSAVGDSPFLEPGGALLLWTTSPDRLAASLAPAGFRLEAAIPVPGSRERAIGVFRKT